MKKYLLSVVMAALFVIGLTSMVGMTSAQEPYPNCQEDCEFLVGIGIFSTQGACMSTCHACTPPGGGATDAVCFCKFLEADGTLERVGINFGQCVKIVKGD